MKRLFAAPIIFVLLVVSLVIWMQTDRQTDLGLIVSAEMSDNRKPTILEDVAEFFYQHATHIGNFHQAITK